MLEKVSYKGPDRRFRLQYRKEFFSIRHDSNTVQCESPHCQQYDSRKAARIVGLLT